MRYLTKRQVRGRFFFEDEEDDPFVPKIEVDMQSPEETGLLDQEGNKLFRVIDQIGFLHHE